MAEGGIYDQWAVDSRAIPLILTDDSALREDAV
jgi:hypothetical protein